MSSRADLMQSEGPIAATVLTAVALAVAIWVTLDKLDRKSIFGACGRRHRSPVVTRSFRRRLFLWRDVNSWLRKLLGTFQRVMSASEAAQVIAIQATLEYHP